MEESKGYFESKNIHIRAISTDNLDDLKKMSEDNHFSFPVLSDESFESLDAYDVFTHREDDPYEDHGKHGEPAHFLTDENGRLLYQHKQTNPFGRPTAVELRKTIQYIKKNLKSE